MNGSAVVADIGGTHARFATIDQDGRLDRIRIYQCAEFHHFSEAYSQYLQEHQLVNRSLAVAVACPTGRDLIDVTNNTWSFSKRELIVELSLDELLVINDFTAQSLASVSVGQDSFETIQQGQEDQFAPIFVIGPGTGLGVGGVIVDANNEWTPLSTEGGHVTMSAQTEDEWRLLTVLRKEYSHVSAERLISGPGLLLIYRTLCASEGVSARACSPQVMIESWKDDPLVRRSLELFSAFFGVVASDGCLTLGATGGCVIAGGVIPKLGEHFPRDIFLDRFRAKGRFTDYLSNIPIKILLDSEAGLYGLQRALTTRSLQRHVVRP